MAAERSARASQGVCWVLQYHQGHMLDSHGPHARSSLPAGLASGRNAHGPHVLSFLEPYLQPVSCFISFWGHGCLDPSLPSCEELQTSVVQPTDWKLAFMMAGLTSGLCGSKESACAREVSCDVSVPEHQDCYY